MSFLEKLLKSKPLPKVGVDEFVFAELVKDERGSNPEWGDILPIPGLEEIGYKSNVTRTPYFADNRKYAENVVVLAEVTAKLADIPPALRAKLFGHDDEKVIMEEGDVNPISIAIGYRIMKLGGGYRYIWVYNTTPVPFDETNQTLTENTSFQADSVIFSSEKLVSTGKRRRMLDDDDPRLEELGITAKMIEDNWFKNPLWDLTIDVEVPEA